MSMIGMEDHLPETDRPGAPVVIKKYANRRLYDTESSIYITLDTLAEMVRKGRDFVVFDAKTGDDITRSVLTQIIVEEETKGRNMLPTAFLRQLISFYGDSMQGLVPGFLENIMEQFSAQQRPGNLAAPAVPAATASKAAASPVPDSGSKTATPIMDRAKSLLTPFYRPGAKDGPEKPVVAEQAVTAVDDAVRAEIRSLRAEVERLNRIVAGRSTSA
ncbi:MAG: polyhydroxyalkanoate synthesis repressor PhaR [Janthinobacterium lividum]